MTRQEHLQWCKTDFYGMIMDVPCFMFKDKAYAPIRAWRIKHIADGVAAQQAAMANAPKVNWKETK